MVRSPPPAVLHTAGVLTVDAARSLLIQPPGEPSDPARFTSGTLFGQPGIYPQGPPMAPAEGPEPSPGTALEGLAELIAPDSYRRAEELFADRDLRERVPEPGIRAALLALADGPAGPVVDAFCGGDTPVLRLGFGEPEGPGRVIGVEQQETDAARRVVNRRYASEHPGVIAPSLAHALCHHGAAAGNAEEATLHGLLAAAHTWLLARAPWLADLGTELARRQNSLTITLLNARRPGSSRAAFRQPDGPGTIPGGDPNLQCPDLWSIPFSTQGGGGAAGVVPEPVRASLARTAPGTAAPVPLCYDEALGEWCTEHQGEGGWFGPVIRAEAGITLGLHPRGGTVGGDPRGDGPSGQLS